MADQQPGQRDPAGRVEPDPTRVADEVGTQAGRSGAPGEEPVEPTTARVVSAKGSAAVPARRPRRRWWSRRAAPPPQDGRLPASDAGLIAAPHPAAPHPAAPHPAAPHPAALPPVDRTRHLPTAPGDEWDVTPAVDPWAEQATPWLPAVAAPDPLPATVVQPPRFATLPAPSTPAPGRPPAPRPAPPARPVSPPAHSRPPTPAPPARPVSPPAHSQPPVAVTPTRPAPGGRGAGGGQPPRRRRRWPRNLLVLTVLSVACCCGVPGYYAWPAAQQYPASAALPQSVADLELRDDRASRRAAEQLAQQLLDVDLVADDVFAGVYGDHDGKRVTLSGMTGLRLTPQADLEAEMRRLSTAYTLTRVDEFDLQETGAHQRCGAGRTDNASVVVCGWADHGSLATVLLTRRSLAESADLVSLLRQSVLTRG